MLVKRAERTSRAKYGEGMAAGKGRRARRVAKDPLGGQLVAHPRTGEETSRADFLSNNCFGGSKGATS